MLSLSFVGEGLVLAGAIEIARDRGHTIAGVFATSASEAAAMARAGLPVSGPSGNVAEFVAACPCDVLLSIANRHILKPRTLSRPRVAALNYHNGPLPAYAGRWAPAWAIMNGEERYGITWHLLAPGIDTGDILVQRCFDLEPLETTGSLNLRCTQEALASFHDVMTKLECGDISGRPQDLARRTYYGLSDVAPGHGMIDWTWPAARIIRLVRACDWGSSTNDFGKARCVVPDGSTHVVTSATPDARTGIPGSILASEGTSLTIACADGAVRLTFERPWVAGDISRPAAAVESEGMDDGEPNAVTAPVAPPPKLLAPVPLLLMRAAAANPHAAAILGDGAEVSYTELVSRAGAMAEALLENGLQHGAGVGLPMPMGVDFIISALGTMLAGGAYVPLNPTSPRARLSFEIAEAGITHVICPAEGDTARFDIPGVRVLDSACIASRTAPERAHVGSGSCAYRIFTSGSTGRPKAVEIDHGALANLVAHYHDALAMKPGDRMTALAHPTFDASVADVWPILCAGGTVLVPPKDILLDPSALIAWIADTEATIAFVPTAIAERLFVMNWPSQLALKALLTGGSTLHHRPPPGLPFRVINSYGPTENTVDSLWAEIEPEGGRPVIGKPIRGVTAQIVDAKRMPLKLGETGELVLGGAQVALGYRGRPELTRERFMTRGGERYYVTGDLARVNQSGDFEFHGRIDDQVQVLGVRVEPGEIESLLKADARVVDAICLPIRTGEQITGLAAHVAVKDGCETSEVLRQDLLTCLRDQLPVALIPRRLQLYRQLPYTDAGKIYRRALAEPDHSVDRSSADDGDPLQAAWLAFLPGSTAAGEDRSFWDLGGDSLAAIELLMRLETETGIHVPVGAFLADPTLAGIRRAITYPALRAPGHPDALPRNFVALQPNGDGTPLFVIHGWGGSTLKFRHMAQFFAPDRPVYGVEAPAGDIQTSGLNSVTALAALYAEQIIKLCPEGPVHLVGHSIGGWYAHAVAGALLDRGRSPGLLGFLDTGWAGPALRPHLQLTWQIRQVTTRLGNLRRDPRKLLTVLHRLTSRERTVGTPVPVDLYVALLRRHKPPRIRASADLFAPAADIANIVPLWRFYALGSLTLHPLFEGHRDFAEAAKADVLANALESAIRRIEGSSAG